MKKFDRRFGKELHATLPTGPGIYRFYNEENTLIYVGKAKNLRRRLSQYRNAKRCKAHAKMRKIIEEAARLEHEDCENEVSALLLETEWIQKHRPKWNIAGAFYFLYPMLGLHREKDILYLCYTTTPDAFPHFQFHGAFRSRERTRDGFFALVELLQFLGHSISKSQLMKSGICPPSSKLGYVYGFRHLPPEWPSRLESCFRGEDFGAVSELSLLLLDRPSAVAKGRETEERLKTVRRFWKHEILTLRKAREHSRWEQYPVSQKDRDLIFIALQHKK